MNLTAVDMDVLHFALQFPVAIVELMVATMLGMRAQYIATHPDARVSDVWVTSLLALFVGAIGLKQGFWMLQGALVAADLHDGATSLGQGHWAPIAGNLAILVTGVLFLSRSGAVFLGTASYFLGGGVSAALLLVAVLILGRG